jgi:hypothetical protein
MFQFSIRTLLIVTTACAVIVWVLFAPPHAVGFLMMLAICFVLPPIVLAGIVYQRNYWRAFFIGAAPWTAALCLWLSFLLIDSLEDGDWIELPFIRADDAIELKLMAGPPLGIICASGLAAVAIRWWAIRRRAPQVDSHPS